MVEPSFATDKQLEDAIKNVEEVEAKFKVYTPILLEKLTDQTDTLIEETGKLSKLTIILILVTILLAVISGFQIYLNFF